MVLSCTSSRFSSGVSRSSNSGLYNRSNNVVYYISCSKRSSITFSSSNGYCSQGLSCYFSSSTTSIASCLAMDIIITCHSSSSSFSSNSRSFNRYCSRVDVVSIVDFIVIVILYSNR